MEAGGRGAQRRRTRLGRLYGVGSVARFAVQLSRLGHLTFSGHAAEGSSFAYDERARKALPLRVADREAFRVLGPHAQGCPEGQAAGWQGAGAPAGAVLEASSLGMRHLPALLRCMCDAPHWRALMRPLLPLLRPEVRLLVRIPFTG